MEETRSTLLVRLKNRQDQDAWQTFNQLYRPMLLAYARSRGLRQSDAEDVTQECTRMVLQEIDDYVHLGSFKAWLLTITERRVCDHFRRRREVHAGSTLLAAQVDVRRIEDLWEQQWRDGHLRYCLNIVQQAVAPNTFAAFMAYAIDGKPANKVARTLGLSVDQVYMAKHRVLERMRQLQIEMIGAEVFEVVR